MMKQISTSPLDICGWFILLQRKLEGIATVLVTEGKADEASILLGEYSKKETKKVQETWLDLFEMLIAKYRDGYRVKDMTSPHFQQDYLFYPKWWLMVSGFYTLVRRTSVEDMMSTSTTCPSSSC